MLAHPRCLFLVLAAALTGAAAGQSPPGGPPGYELGRVLPPPVRDRLQLTPEQERQLDAVDADRDGKTVAKDRFVPDAVVVSFTDTHLVVRSRNLPNHPTAAFPDRSRFLDGNPNVIREQDDTRHVPLEPKENPDRVAMTAENKRGLPMGPVGVAANGVVFFNPFDHIAEADAVWRLDRCCGHPSPTGAYHYHKYPACVNTPWDDDGAGHSPVIGFAFDGYPVYGPYEATGVLAKDATGNPLNAFNLHADAARGPHYHVTPGKFPHILGGYWGVPELRNRPPRGGPPR